MCGIVALIAETPAPVDAELVRNVSARLCHRGPDDHGLLVWDPQHGRTFRENVSGHRTSLGPDPSSPVAGPGACLAARRLAIIDLGEGGHQPMVDEHGRAVVFNGEIYNYPELRTALTALGHRFVTRSDTEVLLAAYAEWGVACLDRLVGMFAFVILDTRSGAVFIARDPFGMKPLFHARVGAGWLFASELGPILEVTRIRRTANPRSVVDYLTTARTTRSDSETVFTEVSQVPPGAYIRYRLGAVERPVPKRYWQPLPPESLDVSFEEATTLVRDAFLESIRLHLRSDVPVGVILSGGMDSSSVTMAMRHVAGDRLDIHTFSYIGEDDAPSEERWIDVVNRAARTIPHKLRLTSDEWASTERRSYHQGEPSGSLAVYAQNRLYREAGLVGARVAMSGQGGDEVFAGYTRHWTPRVASMIDSGHAADVVRFLRRIAAARQPTDPSARSALLHALVGLGPTWARRWAARWSGRRARRRLVDREYASRHGVFEADSGAWQAWSAGRALHGDLASGLAEGLPTLLRYEDRNSMEHEVEARLPFLTRSLVETALSLPERYLVGDGGTCKLVLREAMRGIVPDEVIDRPVKIGFAVPHRSWPARIPQMRVILNSALELPPVSDLPNRDLLDKARRPGGLDLADGFALWRLVGLSDWARDFEVDFG